VAAKPKIVVATKIDAASADQRRADFEEGGGRPTATVEEFKEFCERQGLEFHAISAATGQGLIELLRAVWRRLDELKLEELKCKEIDDKATTNTKVA
jgi:hypothetical protein